MSTRNVSAKDRLMPKVVMPRRPPLATSPMMPKERLPAAAPFQNISAHVPVMPNRGVPRPRLPATDLMMPNGALPAAATIP